MLRNLLEKILREKVKENTGKMRLIKLPSKIIFKEISNKKLSLSMPRDCVNKNVQDDSAAFEAWILILKSWTGYNLFELNWDSCRDNKDLHYQRFLYRVYHFNKLFKRWFSIGQESIKNMKALRIEFNSKNNLYILNVPGNRKDTHPERENSEAGLECKFIKTERRSLADAANLNIKTIQRQLPVGLFFNSVGEGNEIFSGRKSAIDIWGIGEDGKTLNIFELKKEGNIKAGVISELFFYSMIMEDARNRLFKFNDEEYGWIGGIKRIHSYILAPKLHPLVTKEVLKPLNIVLRRKGLYFGYIQFDKNLLCEKKW